MSAPQPAHSQEPSDRDLFDLARAGDARARERLIERYLPLTRRLASRYRRSEEPLDDLEQVAAMGLVKAVDRYDPGRETAFSSFAVPTILGELRRHFRDRTWSVRVPRELQELVLACEKAIAALLADRGRAPTVAEVASAVGVGEEQVLDALQAAGAYRAGSLDAPRAGAGAEAQSETLGETIGAEEAGFARAEERATLQSMFERITERERLVLTLRFVEDLTQAEIGERIGVSQMHVSRLIRQALNRLREGVRDRPYEETSSVDSPLEDPPREPDPGERPPSRDVSREEPPTG
jgi:RNA polymerase sigma-B factor